MPDAEPDISPQKSPEGPPIIHTVPIAGHIRTVFNAAEETRLSTGLPLPASACLTVAQRALPRYTASPGTARDLALLVGELERLGCDFRVRQLYRDNRQQADLHARYSRWMAAGRPKPGARGWDGSVMSTAAASQPNRSWHGAGMAMDIGLSNLRFGDGLTGDAALDRFWDIAAPYGFTPIIREPRMTISEAWHFDHMGPLRAVRDLFIAHKEESEVYRAAAGLAAEVGCVLLGTHSGFLQPERTVQARLLLEGVFVGAPDGKIGAKTRAGLAEFGIKVIGTTPASEILTAMDEQQIGFAKMREL